MIGIIHPIDGKVYELVPSNCKAADSCQKCEFLYLDERLDRCGSQPTIPFGTDDLGNINYEALCVVNKSHYIKPKLD